MKREKVQSSFISAIGYDPAEKTLEIEFKGKPKKTFQYFGVSGKKFESLMSAPSKGEFFNDKIQGKHEETQVAA